VVVILGHSFVLRSALREIIMATKSVIVATARFRLLASQKNTNSYVDWPAIFAASA